jgi:hypothetical protein
MVASFRARLFASEVARPAISAMDDAVMGFTTASLEEIENANYEERLG